MPPRYPQLARVPLPGGPCVNHWMIRDQVKRHVFAENEVTRLALKSLAKNTTLPMKTRLQAHIQLDAMPSNSRPVQIANRCRESGGRAKQIKEYRLHRYQFRMRALAGELPGVRAATWLR